MLHGTIQLNDHEICEWQAANTGEKVRGDTVYACTIKGTDIKGYRFQESFAVLHHPSDGAFSLVQGIMSKADFLVRKD